MIIQWYPGHMVKAKKEIIGDLKLIDVIVELLDARIPFSSQNPDLGEMAPGKPRVIVLNKADLASEEIMRKWINYFKKQGIKAVAVNSITGKGLKDVEAIVRQLMKEKLEKSTEKGRVGRPIRLGILGIPNVGKSAYINKVAGRAATITADRPGVTRKKQWVNAGQGIELMDTPGVLWPRFDNQEVGLNLAFTGAIRQEILDNIELSIKLVDKLKEKFKQKLIDRYKLDNIDEVEGEELLKLIAKKRGCIVSGGNIDLDRASLMVLDEFRSGKIGKITLEEPDGI